VAFADPAAQKAVRALRRLALPPETINEPFVDFPAQCEADPSFQSSHRVRGTLPTAAATIAPPTPSWTSPLRRYDRFGLSFTAVPYICM
jgi:hypothetical protein